MHAPRPYGLVCDSPLSADDLAAVETLARNLTNFKGLSHLDSLKRSITLSDGRIATAVDMGGVFKVLVSSKKDAIPPEKTGLAHGKMPMLFCGAVKNGLVRGGDGVELALSEQCRRRLNGYKPDRLPDKKQVLQRFVVELPDHLGHLRAANTGIYTQTQYWRMRPTWHSGSMAAVVQCAAGFGRLDFERLPENAIERAELVLPDGVLEAALAELGDVRLPGYLGTPPESGQLQYRYTAAETDAVAFDRNNVPWLLRVSAVGVLVMPLPLIPVSVTQAFRDFAEQAGDGELLYLLDRFGGIPSGETFPTNTDAWIRAGVVVRLGNAADFYRYTPVYDACGWSFNSRGGEGFNTCFEYDDKGLMRVYAYNLNVSLGGVAADGENRLGYVRSADGIPAGVSRYLASVLADLPLDDVGRAIRYKMRRTDMRMLSERAAAFADAAQERDFWDRLVLPPIASGSVQCRQVYSGAVYRPRADRVKCVPELKFPVLDAKGCASLPLDLERYIKDGGQPVRCDTVVWGGYVNDTLRVIRYFYDNREYYSETQSDFEDVMIVGSWEKTETAGMSGLAGSIYTSDFDDRDEVAPTVTHTKITGKDLGYGKPLYRTPRITEHVGSVGRARYYSTETETRIESGAGFATAACVPVYGRDCVMYAYKKYSDWSSREKTGAKNAIADPYSYQMWTHDELWHWRGTTLNGNKGDPRPKDGKPVYVDTEIYSPNAHSDFADNGPWMSPVADITGIVGRYTSGSEKHVDGVLVGGESPPYREFREFEKQTGETSGCLKTSADFADALTVHGDLPHNWFFGVSPVLMGSSLSYFWRDMCRNACGLSDYGNIDETRKSGGRYSWGRCSLVDDSAAWFFIGVVNG